MHAVESELIKVTGYKVQRKFSNRQDYLGSILNAVLKISDDAFDGLTMNAAKWANAAVEAKNARSEILPDFDEIDYDEEGEEYEVGDDDEPDTGPDTDGESDDADSDENSEEEKSGGEAEPDDDADSDPEPVPVAAKAKAKKLPAPPKKPVAEKYTPPKKEKSVLDDPDVILDKWGCMEGSKNSKALALFEQGATAREVKDKLGGTYYNILGRCAERGHLLEKEGALIKLTHKDDVGLKAQGKPVKKKK
jgi:hypothetical protein